jgi:pyridoxamine 5'-phosphate oxidase
LLLDLHLHETRSLTVEDSPIDRFQATLDRARAAPLPIPHAMALATASATGRPSVRTVLLRGVDERGFVFFTDTRSPKAQDLAANPFAALSFFWPPPLDEQVRVEGSIEPVTDAEADSYFAARPVGSQLGAWASVQSSPIASRAELLGKVAEVASRFERRPVPRPAYWSGYRVVPSRIEFWFARADRLHERILYTRSGEGWTTGLLSP